MGGHSHPHQHPHSHSHEHENPHAGQGPVLVDIGEDAGALVIRTPAHMTGAEIEAGEAGRARTGLHVAVLPRQVAGGVVHAAVFPTLRAGQWLLWPKGGDGPGFPVSVAAGRVTETAWPQP